jgi:hypothetical protein
MMKIIRAADRHFSDFGWLKTCWLFSFADYYDPDNLHFGALRVFNDDVIAPQSGFPAHPHREMEIITLVMAGAITHADSMGNRTIVGAGDVQRMSAGTGVTHSEFNLANQPVHLYQIWMEPDAARLPPSYDQKPFAPEQWRNRLLPVASGQGLPDTVTFHTDATIYRSELDAGQKIDLVTLKGRCVFIYLSYGRLAVNGVEITTNDQLRISSEGPLHLEAVETTGFILIDSPK